MIINSHTKISEILKTNPLAIEEIVKLSPMFSKLRNPLLRKMMAPRVTISQAARIGNCKVEDFFNSLKSIGFEIEGTPSINVSESEITTEKPEWLRSLINPDVVEFDVRPLIAGGNDPLNEILKKIKQITPSQILCIVNTFEPIPLINLLGKKGFLSFVENLKPNEVRTYFKNKNLTTDFSPNSDTEVTSAEKFTAKLQCYKGKLIEIDVRNMEMPLPMLTILEKLQQLPKGHALFVNHKKVPMHLLPELEERGFEFLIYEKGENDVKLLIHHKS